LASFDLQRKIFRVDAALGEAAGDKPKARLRGSREHVAQLLSVAESPNRTDAASYVVAEQFADQMLRPLVARGQHDQVGGERFARAPERVFPSEARDFCVPLTTALTSTK